MITALIVYAVGAYVWGMIAIIARQKRERPITNRAISLEAAFWPISVVIMAAICVFVTPAVLARVTLKLLKGGKK